MSNDGTTKCPYCQEVIAEGARKCRFCGEILDSTLRDIENLKSQQANAPYIINNNNNNNNNMAGMGGYPIPPKSRIVYILLALFFGGLGVHNFYAGRSGAGVAQLLITLFLFWLIFPIVIVGIWVIIEMIVVTRDGRGIPFN